MEYLVTPSERTDWKVELAQFSKLLSEDWPDVEMRKVENPDRMYALEWTLNVDRPNARLDGALQRSGHGIGLDGPLEGCARFAIWFRAQVPPEQPLLFYDQGCNAYVPLNENTTVDDILKAFVPSLE